VVIQSRVCINGVQRLLLGARIFWPRLFESDPAATVEERMDEPVGDGLKTMDAQLKASIYEVLFRYLKSAA
jgi:hypothetical protein